MVQNKLELQTFFMSDQGVGLRVTEAEVTVQLTVSQSQTRLPI